MRRYEPLYDLITLLMILASVGVIGFTILLVSNPSLPLNPLPPPTLPAVLERVTFTPSPPPSPTSAFSPTPTVGPSATPTVSSLSATPSPPPSLTPTVSATPSPVLTTVPTLPPPPTVTLAPTPVPNNFPPLSYAPTTNFAFVPRQITAQSNSNEQDCDWLSIAGTVTGAFGQALLNLPIEVTGQGFAEVQFSGSAPQFGPSGFEINVGDEPEAKTFSVRVLTPFGEPASDYVVITTGETCQTNVVVIQFIQVQGY